MKQERYCNGNNLCYRMDKTFLCISCFVISSVLVAHGKQGFSNDLTGIRAAGNKLVNHKKQRVVLRVSRRHEPSALATMHSSP